MHMPPERLSRSQFCGLDRSWSLGGSGKESGIQKGRVSIRGVTRRVLPLRGKTEVRQPYYNPETLSEAIEAHCVAKYQWKVKNYATCAEP